MGILAQKSKFKIAKPTIRVEKVAVEVPQPKARPARPLGDDRASSNSPRPQKPQPPRVRASASPLPFASSSRASSSLSSGGAQQYQRKRKASSAGPAAAAGAPRRSPANSDRVTWDQESDSEDDDAWEDTLDDRKRQRTTDSERTEDPNRRLVSPALTDPPPDGKDLRLIHAADVASLKLKCTPSLGAPASDVRVALQYPGLRQRERYELVSGKDMIDAVEEIKHVINCVVDTYLTENEARPFTDANNGLIRQLERSSNLKDYKAFRTALDKYNLRLRELQESGAIARNLAKRHILPFNLVQLILQQVYDRTVAPRVELLAKYENGTDNVYGELLHPFISEILVQRLKMTSDQVFVDLGSGVGNVVLQAALDIGCESWGCEMMENACNLADAQKKEFTARCRLWGIAPGKVRLERGDFRTNERTLSALKRADVVLVNNQAFTAQLNDDLVRIFLDLRKGCKIVSLKSFVHEQKNAANDVGSSILDVERLSYPEGYVSWTGAGGQFCISTRK
ncbi:uncharacterized protein PgNI_09465 [Pyricularia grisea]|uniref:Histone-lysine N-methyltransferase, H3 lysine-79 specific n=1 Tax=Pyricularia grisea TaxID=148305 RepID=A0A6P8AS22_PYRGI|nr:uncharacterized protein PgNI_09465 [Pyricularia grisea]TLD04897.1 hypothetical protein PgNI_09465 [Pyricularia grisea]